jgi:hypothetical protein
MMHDDDDDYGFHSQEEFEEWEMEWYPENFNIAATSKIES